MKLFDAHSDIWSDVTVRRLRGERHVLRERHLERLRAGGVEGGIFVIWVDPPFDADPAARTEQIMEAVRAELAEESGVRLVRSWAELEAARTEGTFYILLGIEGLAAVGEDVERIDWYYACGARHAGLTWNEENALATGVRGDPDRGLTAAGRAAVRKIQERGMLLDVSHLNERSFWDAADAAVGPIAASHSNCRALCDVPRNLTDEQLRAVRDLGGVVGLNAFRLFVDPDPRRQDLAHLLRHAGHMIDVMGVDHVGCGFDFCEFLEADTMASMTEGDVVLRGLEDCARLPALLEGLRDMGLTAEEAEKIAFGNFHRLLRQVLG